MKKLQINADDKRRGAAHSVFSIFLTYMLTIMCGVVNAQTSAEMSVCGPPCTVTEGATTGPEYGKPTQDKRLNPPAVTTPSNHATNPNTTGCQATVTLIPPVLTPTTNCPHAIKSITNNAPPVFPVGTTVVTWTVTDIYDRSTTVSQNVVVTNKMAGTATGTDETCAGDNDGTVIVSASGGVPPYSGTGTITGVSPGTHAYTITDNIGCTTSVSHTTNAGPAPTNWYPDADNDGFGNPAIPVSDCGQPAGHVPDNTDCNDGNNLINPGAPEICGNGIDDNCNTLIDENCAGVTLNVKLYLQGYYTGGGMMDNSGAGGYMFVTTVSPNISDADTVDVAAMDATAPYGLIDEKQGILQTNGQVSVTMSNAVVAGNQYYLRVKHHNSNETWSKLPVTVNAITFYDFSNAATQAFGDNQIITFDNLFYAFYSGDINQDGAIDGSDFLILDPEIQAGSGGYNIYDLNGDGAVDGADFLVLDPNIQSGIGAAIP